MKPNIILKKGCSTVESLNSWKEYKSLGTQFYCKLIDLCRPNADKLFNLEILIGIYMYFQKTAQPYYRDGTIYGLKYLINAEQIFGKSEDEMKNRILEIIRTIVFDSSVSEEILKFREKIKCHHKGELAIDYKHYKNRKSTSINNLSDIIHRLMTVSPKEKFKWHPNTSWKGKAVDIIGKYFSFYADCEEKKFFNYRINYSTSDRSACSWEVVIQSLPNETFTDFIIRLSQHDFSSKDVIPHLSKTESWKYYDLK